VGQRCRDAVAPLGAWFAADPRIVVEQARLSAAVTHAHPEAAAGAVAVALAVQGIPAADLIEATAAWTPDSEVASRLRRAGRRPFTAEPQRRPAEHVLATAGFAGAGRENLGARLALVGGKDPLLAFGEDGVALQSGLPLPGRPTWLLFPGDPGRTPDQRRLDDPCRKPSAAGVVRLVPDPRRPRGRIVGEGRRVGAGHVHLARQRLFTAGQVHALIAAHTVRPAAQVELDATQRLLLRRLLNRERHS
jgi:ADP-ribosylglycohydrolase